jgi:hypothetical protein
MPNMSYCRYENTARAMEDCIDTLMYSDCSEDLSVYETDALAKIQLLAMDIINLQDKIGNIIDNNKERFVTN